MLRPHLLTACAAVALIAGCGGGEGPRSASVAGRLGQPLLLRGTSLLAQTSANRSGSLAIRATLRGARPPLHGYHVDPGNELLAFDVHLENVGPAAYVDSLPDGELELADGTRVSSTQTVGGTGAGACEQPRLSLRSGEGADVCLAFEVHRDARPRRVELTPAWTSGDVGSWAINGDPAPRRP